MNKLAFYERARDEKPFLILAKNCPIGYPPHYHGVFELFIVKKGRFFCSCDGKRFEVSDGCIALFDHYDLHYFDYLPIDDTIQYVLTIPSKYLSRFNERRKGKRVKENVIHDAKLCQAIIDVLDRYIERNDEYKNQAVIDLIFAMLFDKIVFTDQPQGNDYQLIKDVLIYIEQNFRSDISRKTIAKALGYTESYVSRVFHRHVGYTIPRYVNILRIEYVEQNKDGNKNLTSLILDSGFKSVQSYYRNKKELFKE